MDETSGGTPTLPMREAMHPKKGSCNQSHQFDQMHSELAMLAFCQSKNQTLQAQFSSILSHV